MIFDLADWRVEVDLEATRQQTTANASDHCGCAYCNNFYETLPRTYPGLCAALTRLGINPMGPSELMPFTPTTYLACYRVQGQILRWGRSELGLPLCWKRRRKEPFSCGLERWSFRGFSLSHRKR